MAKQHGQSDNRHGQRSDITPVRTQWGVAHRAGNSSNASSTAGIAGSESMVLVVVGGRAPVRARW